MDEEEVCGECGESVHMLCSSCGNSGAVCSRACMDRHQQRHHARNMLLGTVGIANITFGEPKPSDSVAAPEPKPTHAEVLALHDKIAEMLAANNLRAAELNAALASGTTMTDIDQLRNKVRSLQESMTAQMQTNIGDKLAMLGLMTSISVSTDPRIQDRFRNLMLRDIMSRADTVLHYMEYLINLFGVDAVELKPQTGLSAHHDFPTLVGKTIPTQGILTLMKYTFEALNKDIVQTVLTFANIAPAILRLSAVAMQGCFLDIMPVPEGVIGYGSYAMAVQGTLVSLSADKPPTDIVVRVATNSQAYNAVEIGPKISTSNKKELLYDLEHSVRTIRMSTWICRVLMNMVTLNLQSELLSKETGWPFATVYAAMALNKKSTTITHEKQIPITFAAAATVVQRATMDLRQYVTCVLANEDISFRSMHTQPLFAVGTPKKQPRAKQDRSSKVRTELIISACEKAIRALYLFHLYGLYHGDPSFANIGLFISTHRKSDNTGNIALVTHAKLFDMDFAAISPEFVSSDDSPLAPAIKQANAAYIEDMRASHDPAEVPPDDVRIDKRDIDDIEYLRSKNEGQFFKRPKRNIASLLARVWQGLQTSKGGSKDRPFENFISFLKTLLAACDIRIHSETKTPLSAPPGQSGVTLIEAPDTPQKYMELRFVGVHNIWHIRCSIKTPVNTDYLMFCLHMIHDMTGPIVQKKLVGDRQLYPEWVFGGADDWRNDVFQNVLNIVAEICNVKMPV